MTQLQGKIALVTGAAGGFGEGIARLFVAQGARVMIADLDEAKATESRRQAEEAVKNAASDIDLAKATSELAVMAAQIAALRKFRQKK